MIYIYDSIVGPMDKTFKRYGATYKLEKRSRMGDNVFYSFVYPGMEKLLVVPRFAEQYREAEAILKKFAKNKSFEDYLKMVQRQIDRQATYDEYPDEDSETGVMQVIVANYKDIQIQFDCMNRKLKLQDEFTIMQNNIFGNGNTVLMNMNMEV